MYLPARSVAARRSAIAGEGAEVVIVDGTYEEAVARAAADGAAPGVFELADVGASGPAEWVIDGYATLFSELDTDSSVALVPVGVGSLGAAAARWGAAAGVPVLAVEPDVAACLTASLAAGEPTVVDTPGTAMAGLDCAEVSLGRLADAAARHPRDDHRLGCGDPRRDARAGRAGPGDRRLGRRDPGRAAQAALRRELRAPSSSTASC